MKVLHAEKKRVQHKEITEKSRNHNNGKKILNKIWGDCRLIAFIEKSFSRKSMWKKSNNMLDWKEVTKLERKKEIIKQEYLRFFQ